MAITVVPNTDVVVRAVHAGVLLGRLKLGLERIYVSEMVCVRAPTLEPTIRALAQRFPERLVLVKAQRADGLAAALGVKRVRAVEYQFVGRELTARYEADFGYDKWSTPDALAGMIRMRVGDIPRGSNLLFLHELPLAFERWAAMDVDAMLALEREGKLARLKFSPP